MAPRRVILLASLWGDERSSKNRRARQACLNYLEARGLAVEADPETITAQGRLLASGEPAFPPLGAGTIAVVPSLEHLADNARDLREGLYALIATGVEVHIAELGGPITAQLPGLMRGLSFAEAAEARLAAAKEAHAESEAGWSALFEQYKRDLFGRMVAKFGVPSGGFGPEDFRVPSLLAAEHKVGSRPHAPAEEPEDCKPLGAYVRALREALDWKQPMLAEQLDIDVSGVSRLEKTGKGPNVLPAIRVLAGQEEFDTFQMLSPAGRVLLAEKRAAELERASASKLPIWTPEQIAAVPAA